MLNKEQIMEILPHRPPMLLVDEILEMDENHVVGALHLTGDEFFFQGHFPGNPIMPAVFRLEPKALPGLGTRRPPKRRSNAWSSMTEAGES